MHDLRDRRRLPHIDVTATTLKWYGCITMLFYAVSMSVIQNGMLHVSRFSNTELREMWAADADLMVLSSWAAVFQLLGGLAVPVFAFLLVEGFLHTKSFRRYLLRMLLFALVSEVPFDFAMGGKLIDRTQQNMLFTLAVGLIMLYGMKTFSVSRVVQVLVAVAAVFWCALMKTQFGLCMILLIAAYYLLRDKKASLLATNCQVRLDVLKMKFFRKTQKMFHIIIKVLAALPQKYRVKINRCRKWDGDQLRLPPSKRVQQKRCGGSVGNELLDHAELAGIEQHIRPQLLLSKQGQHRTRRRSIGAEENERLVAQHGNIDGRRVGQPVRRTDAQHQLCPSQLQAGKLRRGRCGKRRHGKIQLSLRQKLFRMQ